MFAHGRLKLQTRDQLQNLTENTAYSVHGGISVRWYWFSTINPTYRRFHLAALAAQSLTLGGSHLIWTRVAGNQDVHRQRNSGRPLSERPVHEPHRADAGFGRAFRQSREPDRGGSDG